MEDRGWKDDGCLDEFGAIIPYSLLLTPYSLLPGMIAYEFAV